MSKNWKRLLAVVLCAVLVLGSAATALAADAPEALTEAVSEYNELRPNNLGIAGYFAAELPSVAGREIRVYIPETANIRPFFYFIAIDNDVDPDEFLVDSGWKQIADETGECLYFLLPNQETKTWGTAREENAYMKAAKDYHGATGKYTTLGEFYLVGYGAGRVWIEGLRTDQLQIGSTGIAVSQVLSGVLVVGGIAVWILMRRRAKEAPVVPEVMTADDERKKEPKKAKKADEAEVPAE